MATKPPIRNGWFCPKIYNCGGPVVKDHPALGFPSCNVTIRGFGKHGPKTLRKCNAWWVCDPKQSATLRFQFFLKNIESRLVLGFCKSWQVMLIYVQLHSLSPYYAVCWPSSEPKTKERSKSLSNRMMNMTTSNGSVVNRVYHAKIWALLLLSLHSEKSTISPCKNPTSNKNRRESECGNDLAMINIFSRADWSRYNNPSKWPGRKKCLHQNVPKHGTSTFQVS